MTNQESDIKERQYNQMALNPYHCAAGVESFPAEITH